MSAFNEANKIVHPVEKQWHYAILIKYGYEAITKSDVGFVRSYNYTNPKFPGKTVICTTGANADYWQFVDDSSLTEEEGGYWSELEPFLKKQQEL